MATYQFHATTTRSASEVFAYFADMVNAPSWDPSISSVVRLDEGAVAQDSSFLVTLGFLGRDLALTYRLVTFEPPTRVVLRAETKLFVSEDEITVARLDDGTTALEYVARLSAQRGTRLLDPLFRIAINHFGTRAGQILRQEYLR